MTPTRSTPDLSTAEARALLDAAEAHRLAVTRRDQKAKAFEEAQGAAARIREEREAAIRSGDRVRAKTLGASIADAELELEIAQQALGRATEDEMAAAAELARLTEEDQERRRRALVTAKFGEGWDIIEREKSARKEVIHCHGDLDRVTEELRNLGALVHAENIRLHRLTPKEGREGWGSFLKREGDAMVPTDDPAEFCFQERLWPEPRPKKA